MIVELLTAEQVTESTQLQVANLYRQLNPNIEQRSLSEILAADNKVVIVIIGKADENIVGIALLSCYKVISGYRGLVEDVVVDASQRGKGIGKKLMRRLLEEGEKMGLDEILLFTGHHRTPAIALYKSLGFTMRESGVYNLKLS